MAAHRADDVAMMSLGLGIHLSRVRAVKSTMNESIRPLRVRIFLFRRIRPKCISIPAFEMDWKAPDRFHRSLAV